LGKRNFTGRNTCRSAVAGETGQSEYINQLYLLYWPALCEYLRSRFGTDPGDPEDIAQLTFTRFAGLENYRDIKNPKAFLFATARNIAVDEFRKARIRLAHLQDNLNKEVAKSVDDFSPENVLLLKERLALMHAAIEKLPEKQRRILLLHRLDKMTYTQIAEKTGMSETTVRRMIAKAVERIYRQVETGD